MYVSNVHSVLRMIDKRVRRRDPLAAGDHPDLQLLPLPLLVAWSPLRQSRRNGGIAAQAYSVDGPCTYVCTYLCTYTYYVPMYPDSHPEPLQVAWTGH